MSSLLRVHALHGPSITCTTCTQQCHETEVSLLQVLIIHGEKDALVPRWNSQKLAALLDADLEVFQDCGHMPMEEMPDRFIATVAKFLPKCI